MTASTRLQVSEERIASAARRVMGRCEELARVTSTPGSITRVYLSPEHARVNRLAAEWMRELGMTTRQDAAGNQVGRLAPAGVPDAPALLLGSHLDTVPDAGRYDGIVGVLMALEVVRLLRRVDDEGTASSPFPFALEVIAFSDEEGTRFGKALLGSSAVAGQWDPAWWELADADGLTLREAFRDFGLDPGRVGEAARRPDQLVAYLEAHIEQAPSCTAADKPSPRCRRSRRRGGSSSSSRERRGTRAARPTTCGATPCSARARPRWRSSGSAAASTTSWARSVSSRPSPARSTSCPARRTSRSTARRVRRHARPRVGRDLTRARRDHGTPEPALARPRGAQRARGVLRSAAAGRRARGHRRRRPHPFQSRRSRRHGDRCDHRRGHALPAQPRRHQPPPAEDVAGADVAAGCVPSPRRCCTGAEVR